MDTTDYLIDVAMTEERKFNPNHYNICLTPERQAIVSKLKPIDDRVFKSIRRLVEAWRNFVKVKMNVYRDFRTDNTIVILRAKPKSEKYLTSLISSFHD